MLSSLGRVREGSGWQRSLHHSGHRSCGEITLSPGLDHIVLFLNSFRHAAQVNLFSCVKLPLLLALFNSSFSLLFFLPFSVLTVLQIYLLNFKFLEHFSSSGNSSYS